MKLNGQSAEFPVYDWIEDKMSVVRGEGNTTEDFLLLKFRFATFKIFTCQHSD